MKQPVAVNDAVFPLRMTPFEWIMLEDFGQTSPMSYVILLKFEGKFKPELFENAVSRTVEDHPLLRAHVVGSRGSRPKWVAAPHPHPFLHLEKGLTACHFPGSERFDLHSETGLRIWVRYDDQQTEMRFQFHHACCDGIGAFRFIEDVMCWYHFLRVGASAQDVFRPLERGKLKQRHCVFTDRISGPRGIWRSGVVHPSRVLRSVIRRPAPILRPDHAESKNDSLQVVPDLPFHRFTRSESKALRRVAGSSRATTNELMLRDLMLTIDQWNQTQGSRSPRRTLRLLVPISLRTRLQDNLPASNVMSLVSVLGHARDLDVPERLLENLVAEMAFIRRWRVDLFLHEEGRLVGGLPGIDSLFHQLSSDHLLSSALSNVGKLFARSQLPRRNGKLEVGDMTLEAVTGAPPVSSCAATFGSHWYAGELSVTINYDRRQWGAADANRLLSAYVQRLLVSAKSEAIDSRR